MTPDERQMISDLFDRLRSMGGQEKDREAEAYIAQLMRQTPDAAYLMAQLALMQGFEIQQAGDRIAELEQQLAGSAPAPRGGGSFLNRGAAGAGAAAGTIGARANPMVYGEGGSQPAQPWGNASAGYQGRPATQQGSASGPPPQAQPIPHPAEAAPQRSGGGFLRSAMAAAAGVAGGVLMADSIRGMFGGGHANASTGSSGSGWNEPSDKAGDGYKDDDGSNDQGDTGWSDGGGGDTET